MGETTLYDEDILLWSEQQAELIRRLGRTRRDLPNEFDVENVAEEIESVGRSELAAVKGLLRQILLHLIKLAVQDDAAAARHWRGEIVAFHSDMIGRYAASMRQRIDLDELWWSAREQMQTSYEGTQEHLVQALPVECPIEIDDLLGNRIDATELAGAVRRKLSPTAEA